MLRIAWRSFLSRPVGQMGLLTRRDSLLGAAHQAPAAMAAERSAASRCRRARRRSQPLNDPAVSDQEVDPRGLADTRAATLLAARAKPMGESEQSIDIPPSSLRREILRAARQRRIGDFHLREAAQRDRSAVPREKEARNAKVPGGDSHMTRV